MYDEQRDQLPLGEEFVTPEARARSEEILSGANDVLSDPEIAKVMHLDFVQDADADLKNQLQATHLEVTKKHTITLLEKTVPGLKREPSATMSRQEGEKRAALTRFLAYFMSSTSDELNDPDFFDGETPIKPGFVDKTRQVLEVFAGQLKMVFGERKDDVLEREYRSIGVQVVRRMNEVRRRMKVLGENYADIRVATAFTTLIPFIMAGEARRSFEFSQRVLWWLRRTSRINLENRRGAIEGKPQDEFLRSEQSSFPLAFEIEPTGLGQIIVQKLERYAQNRQEYMLDKESKFLEKDKDKVKILLWFGNKPRYIQVDLSMVETPSKAATAGARIETLIAQAEQEPGLELTPEQMRAVRNESYGKYQDQSQEVQSILDADISVVIGQFDLQTPDHIMKTDSFVTGGARVRECIAVNVQPRSPEDILNDRYTVDAVANKFSHARGDGKLAQEWIKQDFAKRPRPESYQAPDMLAARVMSSEHHRLRFETWKPDLYTSQEKREFYGFEKISREQSQFWIDAVSVLRLISGEKLSLADLMSYAQMLSSRTRGSHFLESHQEILPTKEGNKAVEVLDVAYNVLPDEFMLHFDAYMQEIAQTLSPAKKQRIESEQGKVRALLLQELATFRKERELAKKGMSMASFMSTLAGGIKNIEQVIKSVSESGIAVGELVTEAVANPRGGLISMLAETQRLPGAKPGEPKWLWFGSANTDSFVPNDPGEENENWGGVLGITSVPGEGFAFMLRKLGVQSQEPRELGAAEARLRDALKRPPLKGTMLEGKTVHELRELLRKHDEQHKLILDVAKRWGGVEKNQQRIEDELQKVFNVPQRETVIQFLRTEILGKYNQDMQEQAQKGSDVWREEEVQKQAQDIPHAIEFLLQLIAYPVRNVEALVKFYQDRMQTLQQKGKPTDQEKQQLIQDLQGYARQLASS